jgi:hypothetical protein
LVAAVVVNMAALHPQTQLLAAIRHSVHYLLMAVVLQLVEGLVAEEILQEAQQ